MITIALTGGIGSGKSTVSALLRNLGAVVLDSDLEARKILETSAKEEVVAAFGRGVLADDGAIDRKKLARIVFHDPQALASLNRIIHTRLEGEIVERLEHFNKEGADVVVVELALPSEAPWTRRADQTWIVKSSREVILARLKQRGMSEAESLARIASQTPPENTVRGPFTVIWNDGSFIDLKTQVEILWNVLHNDSRSSRSE
jgi:dephospho-CoA kinase